MREDFLMNKTTKFSIGILIFCFALVALSQEIPSWISGSQMSANLAKTSHIGGSEIATSPEVLRIGTNGLVVEGKFYVLQSPNNWVLADQETANAGILAYAHGIVPGDGMILNGKIYNADWAALNLGESLYLASAGDVSRARRRCPR